MQEYARKTLQDMLGSAVSSPDVTRLLGSSLVDEAVLEALLPAMVGFLAMGLSLGSRARTEGGVAIGAAEKVLHTDGREVMRLLLQGLTDLAGGQEERLVGGVLGSDGALRSRVETGHARQVATTVGEITAGRMAYRAPGVGNLHPLDEVLSLPADLYSDGLTELCAREARRSFASTTQSVERATGVRIGTRQVIGLVRRAARDAGAFYSGRDQDTVPAPQDVLVITADGKGVVVRPDALREGTAKAAKKSGTSSGNRKRMAEVACVYDLTPVPRTVDDIITPTGTDPADHEAVPSPTAVNKWLTASIIENIPTVIAIALDEAERRDPTHARTWIALVDGNTTPDQRHHRRGPPTGRAGHPADRLPARVRIRLGRGQSVLLHRHHHRDDPGPDLGRRTQPPDPRGRGHRGRRADPGPRERLDPDPQPTRRPPTPQRPTWRTRPPTWTTRPPWPAAGRSRPA